MDRRCREPVHGGVLRTGRGRARTDGIIAQWVQLYELSPDDVRMVLGEFQRQFPEVTAWNMGVGDLVLIGSRQPLNLDLARVERIVANDESLKQDFRHYLSMMDPMEIMSLYTLSSDEVRTVATGARRNTDDLPLLEFNAPRNLFSDTAGMNVELLNEYKTELLPAGIPDEYRERAYVAMMEPFLENGDLDSAAMVVEELADTLRVNDESLFISMARLNLNSNQYELVEESLVSAEAAAGNLDRYAGSREELWARMAERQGDRESAIERYRRAVIVAPERPDFLLRLAELNALEREWDQAVLWMERYIETDSLSRILLLGIAGRIHGCRRPRGGCPLRRSTMRSSWSPMPIWHACAWLKCTRVRANSMRRRTSLNS